MRLLCKDSKMCTNDDTFQIPGVDHEWQPKKRQFWESVMYKIRAGLNVWKVRFLSLADKMSTEISVYNFTIVLYVFL